MTKLDDEIKEDNEIMSYKIAIGITAVLAWILIKLLLYYI